VTIRSVLYDHEFGLPAFHYTCDQTSDPKAVTQVNPGILGSTEHVHQVGNDRITAIASNYGQVRVRQDEGSPKFLNDYAPERGCYAGGFGYLTNGKATLSTHYPGSAKSFDRVFGAGYFRKKIAGDSYAVNHVIFAPFGDDPVLVSQVTVTNSGASPANLRWIEYWGCQLYQFSFRSFMEGFGGKSMHELRRDFGTRRHEPSDWSRKRLVGSRSHAGCHGADSRGRTVNHDAPTLAATRDVLPGH